MTPREKAKELLVKYSYVRMTIHTTMDSIPTRLSDYPTRETAKACATLLIDTVISEYRKLERLFNGDFKQLDYWKEVKKELSNL